MISKITGGSTTKLFTAKVLSKYDVAFYRCNDTGFIQTEEPFWLKESYSTAITKLDVGLVMRNQNLVEVAIPVILNYFNHQGQFLDYAGGYGLFTRLMRDRGFDFYHTDPFCQNIFAEFHELTTNKRFELVTAFEVLEHLVFPKDEIKKILAYSNNLFFTTELVPPTLKNLVEWWYFSLETGQHISFYTKQALEYIAKENGKHYYTDDKWLHLFTEKPLPFNPFTLNKKRENFFIRKIRKYLKKYDSKHSFPPMASLLDKDICEAKKRITIRD